MKNRINQKHYIDAIATLIAFTLFAVCIVIAIFLGAKEYKAVVERDGEAYAVRTCTQYIANKVHSVSSPESVSVVDIDGVSALEIAEDEFTTYIYCYDGWIRELFTLNGDSPMLSSGEKILEIQELSFTYSDGLLTAGFSYDGQGSHSTVISVRGLGGVV